MKVNETSFIDVQESRSRENYSRSEQFMRVVWALVSALFRITPRPFFRARASILRLMGAKVGARVHIYPSARIVLPWNLEIGDDSSIGEGVLVYNLGAVKIGKRATISHNAQLCAGTHDHKDKSFPLIRATVTIGDETWVCTQALICPFVTIGRGAIIGAGAVVTKDVSDAAVVAGNPAKQIAIRSPQEITKAP